MKVPYTPKLSDSLMHGLQQRWEKEKENSKGEKPPDWKVIKVGQSKEGRPLWLVRIGKRKPRKPCILFYAREHADEHDGSWVAQGVIDFLLSNNPAARAIRRRFTVLVIPLLDPDGAAANVYDRITHTFSHKRKTSESLAWAEFFKQWINQGDRLDIVFNLHNVEAGELPQLSSPQFEPKNARYDACATLHEKFIYPLFKSHGYTVRKRASKTGLSIYRLGGYLDAVYGALMLPYEVNSQAPRQHLSLYELKVMGAYLVRGAAQYLYSNSAVPLVVNINNQRRRHAALWKRYGSLPRISEGGLFYAEDYIRVLPEVEQQWRRIGLLPSFLKPLEGSSGFPVGACSG